MKLLIIGKTGKLGYALIQDAISMGFEVVSLHRKFDITKNGYMNINYLEITDFRLDASFQRILNEIKPDIVINTTAYNNVSSAELNQSDAFVSNCIAVGIMAKICNKSKIPFITFSTNYVFDGENYKPYEEYDTPFPLQVYGLSKLSGEYASLIYDTTIVIRTSVLYGLSESGKNNFVDDRIKDAKNKEPIEIDAYQITCSTYTNDLSKATLQLIIHPCRKSGIYHLTNVGEHSFYQLTKEIYKIMNIDKNVIPVNRNCITNEFRRPSYSSLRNTKAAELGITMPRWDDALKRYLKTKYGV